MNVCFASEKNTIKNITLNKVRGFREVFAPPPDVIDVLVVSGDCDVSEFLDRNIDTCIFHSENVTKVMELKNVNSAISCGMQGIDSVTFSSISEDSALVCIRRSLKFKGTVIDPCEFKASFDGRLGIFYNLVISMIDFLSDVKGE